MVEHPSILFNESMKFFVFNKRFFLLHYKNRKFFYYMQINRGKFSYLHKKRQSRSPAPEVTLKAIPSVKQKR